MRNSRRGPDSGTPGATRTLNDPDQTMASWQGRSRKQALTCVRDRSGARHTTPSTASQYVLDLPRTQVDMVDDVPGIAHPPGGGLVLLIFGLAHADRPRFAPEAVVTYVCAVQ